MHPRSYFFFLPLPLEDGISVPILFPLFMLVASLQPFSQRTMQAISIPCPFALSKSFAHYHGSTTITIFVTLVLNKTPLSGRAQEISPDFQRMLQMGLGVPYLPCHTCQSCPIFPPHYPVPIWLPLSRPEHVDSGFRQQHGLLTCFVQKRSSGFATWHSVM